MVADLNVDSAWEVQDERMLWLEESRSEAKRSNPLYGYCERVYFFRSDGRQRKGKYKGRIRHYRTHEIELLRFLPSGRCVEVKDLRTQGLDALAEEIFAGHSIPPDTHPSRLFLDYFRKL